MARPANQTLGRGRTFASQGYILVRVGKSHHLADYRGYAYEHRVEAEKKLGRKLLAGEKVHHADTNKRNNEHDNLIVVSGDAEHAVHHRRVDRKVPLRTPGQENPIIDCACGCGARISRYDASNRPRRFVTGHNNYAQRRKPRAGSGTVN